MMTCPLVIVARRDNPEMRSLILGESQEKIKTNLCPTLALLTLHLNPHSFPLLSHLLPLLYIHLFILLLLIIILLRLLYSLFLFSFSFVFFYSLIFNPQCDCMPDTSWTFTRKERRPPRMRVWRTVNPLTSAGGLPLLPFAL